METSDGGFPIAFMRFCSLHQPKDIYFDYNQPGKWTETAPPENTHSLQPREKVFADVSEATDLHRWVEDLRTGGECLACRSGFHFQPE